MIPVFGFWRVKRERQLHYLCHMKIKSDAKQKAFESFLLLYTTPASSPYQNILFWRSNHLTLFKCRQIIIRLSINSIVLFSFLQFDLNVISANSMFIEKLIFRLFVCFSKAFLGNGRSSMSQIYYWWILRCSTGWLADEGESSLCPLFFGAFLI